MGNKKGISRIQQLQTWFAQTWFAIDKGASAHQVLTVIKGFAFYSVGNEVKSKNTVLARYG